MALVRSQVAAVAPVVLRWARESAGFTQEEAADRLGVGPDRLARAEAGERPLTLVQVRKAAHVYQRPLAVLFLPEPPSEEPQEVQFRRLRDAPQLPWSPAMRALAREVPALQDEVDALFEAIDEEPRWIEAAKQLLSDVPIERLAERLRQVVGVTLEQQKTSARTDPQGFKTFRLWREAVEDLGILVLQDGSLSLGDMRGFASPHARVPAIVINTNDDVRARLFTMIHELAHVFWSALTESEFEELAGTTLMPSSSFADDFRRANGASLLEKIDATARLYGTTPDATAVRVGWLNLASWNDVRDARAEIRNRGGSGSRAQGGNYYRNVIARMGPRLVGRILDAVGQAAISDLAAARVLGVRVERLESVRRELGSPDVA